MLRFKVPQKVFEIGKVKIGGQPGENPTVLIGTIFYQGHKIVADEKTGEMNRERAEELIKLQEEFSEKTGNPCMLDVVGTTEMAIRKLVSVVADATDVPILIDSPSVQVKVAGTRYAKEVGLKNKVVYNSLVPESRPEEFEAIRETGVESSIVLTFEKGFMTSESRVNAAKRLLPKAEQAGILKPLVDTCVMDVPSLSMACRAILDLKARLGIPSGCGAHNAVSTWAGFKERMGSQATKPCLAAVNTVPVVLGADFILYGPIEDCQYVFPAVAAVNISFKYLYKVKEQLEV